MDPGAWDEIGTKMELALAYMDMDDHDGARAILEEIKREGNDEQRTEAGELLAKLPQIWLVLERLGLILCAPFL